ncbi:hypothetical protein J4214_04845 [Candidatus Woesearchaeota archaeon]|nr:hypothetical protein [Candidatus Woesearchaeota archaeon]
MEKKRIGGLLLISFLFIVIAYLVSGTVSFNSAGSAVNISGNDARNSLTNGVNNGSVWTKGGQTEIINFTINFTTDAISAVNITLPIEAYRLMNYNTRNATISMAHKAGLGNGVGLVTVNWSITNTTSIVILNTQEGNYSEPNSTNLFPRLNIEFNVTANDSIEGAFVWNVSFTDNETTTSDIASAVFTTYVDGLRPRLTQINVTDGVTVLKASSEELNSTKFLKNTSITVYATLTDYNFDEDARPRLFYLINGSEVNITSPAIVMSSSNGSSYTYRLNATIPVTELGGPSIPLAFIIQVNDSYNHMYIYNTSAQDGFNFSIDSANPGVTITPPSSTSIDTSSSITYKCVGTDTGGSGVNSYLWTITKPNGQIITKTTSSITLTGAETEAAGTYSLTCKVTDIVGYETTSTVYQFTGHIASTSGAGGSGGAGGTGATTTETVKVDDSIMEIGETATVSKKQGQSSTFSLDGRTAHTLNFKTVTSGSVTLEIQSDPIEVTLNVGETKNVDLDADGTDDLEVTLDSVSGGAARVMIKKIAQTAAEVASPEPTTETGEGAETTTTPSEEAEGGASLVWLWVVIVLIVIVAVVVAVQKKKK